MRSFVLLAALWLGTAARGAGIEVASVEGASAIDYRGAVQIFGSLAGPACRSKRAGETCNSCARTPVCNTAPLCACNTNRIWDGQQLKIHLKKPDKMIGDALVRAADGRSLTVITPNNGGEFVDLRWSDLCAAMGAAGCEDFFANTNALAIRVGVDENADGRISNSEGSVDLSVRVLNPGENLYDAFALPTREGVAGFRPYPDYFGQVRLGDFVSTPGFPILSYGSRARVLRVFVSDRNMLYANARHALAAVDLGIREDGSAIDPAVIVGLVPGRLYFFRIALVDEGGNVVQYFPDNDHLPYDCVAPMSTPRCPFAAIPY